MQQYPIEVRHGDATIRGTVYRPADGTGRGGHGGRGPAMLMLHRFTGQRTETGFLFVQLARALVSKGIAVVTFDFRHSGESDGSFDQMLPTGELADAERMTGWLLAQPFVDRRRVGVLGYSLGGLIAACLSARVATGAGASGFAAMVLLAPTTAANLCRHAEKLAKDEPLVLGPHRLHPDFFADAMKLDAVADVTRNPRSTLLIQGTGDTAVPPKVSDAFVEAMRQAGIPVDHDLIDGADHAFNRVEWREQLTERVASWVGRRL